MSVALNAFIDELDKIAEAPEEVAEPQPNQLPAVTSERLKELAKTMGIGMLGGGAGLLTAGLGFTGLKHFAPEAADWVARHKLPIIGGLSAAGTLAALAYDAHRNQLYHEADNK